MGSTALILFLTLPLRIHDYGCFVAPRPFPLLRTEEMERESIKENPTRRLWLVLVTSRHLTQFSFFSHRLPKHRAQTDVLYMYHTAHVSRTEVKL